MYEVRKLLSFPFYLVGVSLLAVGMMFFAIGHVIHDEEGETSSSPSLR